MNYICLDLEGVLVPEFWEVIAQRTGIMELSRTTRDEPDYEQLMKERIALLDCHNLGLHKILPILKEISPFDGAISFLKDVEKLGEILILSDTFHLFADPILEKLGSPKILCNELLVSETGRITTMKLREWDGKRAAVRQLKSEGQRIFAVGDSYNDLTMLAEAHGASLFRAPESIRVRMINLSSTENYNELLNKIKDFFYCSIF